MKNLLNDLKNFFSSPSSGRTLVLIGLLILAIAIPVSVTVLQQQTNTQQHASVVNDGGGGGTGGGCSTNGHSCGGTTSCCTGLSCISGTCLSCQPTHQVDVCNGNGDHSICAIADGNTCTMHVAYSGCTFKDGKCGYKAPAATPTPNPAACTSYVDSHTSQYKKGSGFCTALGICRGGAADGDVVVSGADCGGASICCAQVAPPASSCSAANGVCAGLSNTPATVCNNGNVNGISTQDCSALNNGSYCCVGTSANHSANLRPMYTCKQDGSTTNNEIVDLLGHSF